MPEDARETITANCDKALMIRQFRKALQASSMEEFTSEAGVFNAHDAEQAWLTFREQTLDQLVWTD